MKSSNLMVMAYLDDALNLSGRRVVESRLSIDTDLRVQLQRMEAADQLARMAVGSALERDPIRCRARLLAGKSTPSNRPRRITAISSLATGTMMLGVAVTAVWWLREPQQVIAMQPSITLDAGKGGHGQ